MVNARNSLLVGAGVAGVVGGFALDRSLADTPARVASRLPDIARAPDEDYYDSDQDTPSPEGATANGLALWLPLGAAVVGGGMVFGAAGLLPSDRIPLRHPLGVGGLTLAVAGASTFTGVAVSRLVLG